MRSLISTAFARPMREFLADRRGASSIEYALLASCIAVGVATVVVATGTNLKENIYQKIYDAYPS